ncbi:unnamed protein product, partial [Medioppia subpectinata]
MVDNIITNEGIDKPFQTRHYAYDLFASILGSIMYSEKFDNEHPALKKYKYLTIDYIPEVGSAMMMYEFVPMSKYFMADPLAKYKSYFNELLVYTRDIYQKHDKTYDSNSLRDFCDILIAAKHEAIADDKQSAQYLIDDNLLVTLIDMFIAGVDTSQITLMWILLYLAYYPHYQDKLHSEISFELGGREPVAEDIPRLNYTLAFVSEILRHRNVAPMGVFHKTLADCKLGDFSVPRNTQVLVHQFGIMKDAKYWTNADRFEPERFLDEHGQFIQTNPTAYMPFGCGRRICPGRALAINDELLVLSIKF